MVENEKQIEFLRPACAKPRSLRIVLVCALCLPFYTACLQSAAAEFDTNQLPPTADVRVDFNRDIRPIFETTCFRCHGPEKPKSHFCLAIRESALKGGENNPDDIVPGNSDRSKLVFYVSRLIKDMEMPPPDKGKPLTPDQVGLLRAWIDQGASWGTSNAPPSVAFSIEPVLRWIGVDGDNGKFREIEGVKEGWEGGFDHFTLHERLAPDETLSAEGHVLFRDQDYRLKLALEKTDFGFVQGGFESWPKYYDDSGGFAPSLPTNLFRLNRDLHLDIGRAWFDLGLTLPGWPQIVLGYEYQFKKGSEATLQWGPVGTLPPFDPATDAKNIYPAFKYINENTHIIKLDVNRAFYGWQLEDSARVEFYSLETSRQNVTADTFGPMPDTIVRVNEGDSHTQGANTLNINKQFTDWLSVSGGYLYSRLEGNASLNQNTLNGSGALTVGEQWYANNITLKRESQVASVASLVGPWAGLTLSAGAQAEWTRQETAGFENLQLGNPNIPASLFPDASTITGNIDSTSVRENFSLRYFKTPYTEVFAETRLQQESLGRYEQRPDGSSPFTYNADADIEFEEYRAGFNTSPWRQISFGASIKHSSEHADYLNLQLYNPAGYAYPGFLLWRDIGENQVEARLVLRTTSWLRTSFNYRYQETDFDSATAAVRGLTPAGPIEAATQQAHVYSVDTVLTPYRRLYLSTTLSYSDSYTGAAQNGANYLAPWRGNVYSVLSSVTFIVDSNTDLKATCFYSKSDYGQGNQAIGLPAGINYESQGLKLGITRRFPNKIVASLMYGFSQYHEPTSGGANDFTAQTVFGTVAIPWP